MRRWNFLKHDLTSVNLKQAQNVPLLSRRAVSHIVSFMKGHRVIYRLAMMLDIAMDKTQKCSRGRCFCDR